MTISFLTTELLEVLEQEYAANMRPATLQELGAKFDVSAAAVRYALLAHVERGDVVKLPGARGYLPRWAVNAIASEGLKRIQDPAAPEKLEQHLNPPLTARITNCMHLEISSGAFPNQSDRRQSGVR